MRSEVGWSRCAQRCELDGEVAVSRWAPESKLQGGVVAADGHSGVGLLRWAAGMEPRAEHSGWWQANRW